MLMRICIALILLFVVSISHSVNQSAEGKIKKILTDDTYYGGCMVYIEEFESTTTCPNNWVSLSCDGTFNSKENARRMLETAQLAFVTDTNVQITVIEEQLHDGYCVGDMVYIQK